MRLISAVLSGLLLVAAAGCGGGSGGSPSAVVPAAGPKGFATVSFSITIPARTQTAQRRAASAPRHPSYVSSATQSVVVTLDGTVVSPGYFNAVGPTINVSIPNVSTGPHTFQVDAHQGTNGTGAILSTATQRYTVVLDSNNAFALTLNGVVASVTLSVSNPTPLISTTGTPITVTASAQDAAGVPITGTYATPIALTTTDSSDYPVSPSTLTSDVATATVNYSGLCKAPATIGVSNVGTVTPAVVGTNRHFLTSQADTMTPGTLRYNLTNIVTPATIEVIPGGYTITVTSPLPAIPAGQTVCGAQHGVSALISGGGTTNIFTLGAGTVAINGMILNSASSASNGGAISVPAGSTANLSNVIFTSNAATGTASGGAISVAGTMTCTGCTFNNNTAVGGKGGAVYVASGGTATIDNGSFNTNSASNGGAITVDQTGALSVVSTSGTNTFNGNSTSGNGGALYVVGGLTGGAAISGAAFTSNTAASNGGAINSVSFPGSATYSCTLCTFTSNTALSGGAIFMPSALNSGSVTIDRSVFTSNTATGSPGYGGAIADGDYSLNLTNSAFISNQTTGGATDCGGGFALLNRRGAVSISNTLFYQNVTAGSGGALCGSLGGNSNTIPVSYSTIVNNTAAVSGGSIYINANACAQVSADIIEGGAPQNFANVTPVNCGTFTSNGYSLISETVCGTCTGAFPLDVVGTTTFSPTGPAGSPVPYLAITASSAAYNIGVGCSAGTDVRGNPRPHFGSNCSAGEFEP